MHESVEFFCGVPPRLMHYQGMLAMGFDTCVASFGSWSLWVAKPYYSRVGPKTGRPRTRSLAGPLLQRQRGNAGSCQLLGGGGNFKTGWPVSILGHIYKHAPPAFLRKRRLL